MTGLCQVDRVRPISDRISSLRMAPPTNKAAGSKYTATSATGTAMAAMRNRSSWLVGGCPVSLTSRPQFFLGPLGNPVKLLDLLQIKVFLLVVILQNVSYLVLCAFQHTLTVLLPVTDHTPVGERWGE